MCSMSEGEAESGKRWAGRDETRRDELWRADQQADEQRRRWMLCSNGRWEQTALRGAEAVKGQAVSAANGSHGHGRAMPVSARATASVIMPWTCIVSSKEYIRTWASGLGR